MASPELGMAAQEPVLALSLKQRLHNSLIEFSRHLASVKSGALVQVWMPENCSDGTTVLSAQGLPFAVVGVGDLLALFRCVSVRYRFSTDVTRPSLMGAIGRVYATMEPEMSHDVQKYDKQVYLRVSEAQRCRVHSSLMVPVFEQGPGADRPLAVFELVQSDKDVAFPAVMSWLSECLQSMSLRTVNMDQLGPSPGLRQWPMHVDQSLKRTSRPGTYPQTKPLTIGGPSQQGAGGSEGPMQGTSSAGRMDAVNDAATTEVTGERGGTAPPSQGRGDRLDRVSRESNAASQGHGSPTGTAAGPLLLDAPASSMMAAATLVSPAAGAQTGAGASSSQVAGLGAGAGTSGGGGGGGDGQLAQLMSFITANGLNPNVIHSLRALVSNPGSTAPPTASSTPGSGGVASGGGAPTAAFPGQPSQSQAVPLSRAPGGSGGFGGENGSFRNGSGGYGAGGGIQGLKAEPGEEGEEEGIGSDGDDDDDSDDDEGGGKANKNRVDGGAGKRLRFEELQAQFGLGLKEAAANLGICATTLKRACRRHGIKRWPRRQIVKLSKALTQMGYNGVAPPGLVQSAVTGQAGAVAASAGTSGDAGNSAAAAAAVVAAAAAAGAPPSAAAAAAQQQQLAALLATGTAPQQQQQAGSGGQASGGQAGLHPLLAALNQPSQSSASRSQPQQPQQQQQPMMAGQSTLMGPPPPVNQAAMQMGGMQQMPMQQGSMQGMMGQGGMGMVMMPMSMMPNGMGMMMAPVAMQQAMIQQHMQANGMGMGMGGLMPGMMPMPQQSHSPHMSGGDGSMPPPGGSQPGGPAFQPMHFMYGHSMGGQGGQSALVNELAMDGNMGASAMQTSGVMANTMNKTGGFDMGASSTLSIPTGELLHGIDPILLGVGSADPGGSCGLNSQAQMQAIHNLFMKEATGSLENFMEMLSDDLPVMQ